MMKIEGQYRQGDVFIERVPELPVKPKTSQRVVLAQGAATSHSHAVENPVKSGIAAVTQPWRLSDDLSDADGMTRHALKLGADASVVHQEHGPIALKNGYARVTIQREYEPAGNRNVMD